MNCCGKAGEAIRQSIKWASKGFTMGNYRARISICQSCDQYKGRFCMACGCLMAIKARMATTKCPLGKWQNDS